MINSPLPSPTRPRRRLVAMTGALLLTGSLLAACGGSSSDSAEETSPKKETTTTAEASSDAAQQIADDLAEQIGLDDVTDENSLCFGNAMVDGLGDDRALEVFESDDDLLELPSGDQVVIKDSFNECIPAASVSADIVGEFYSSVGSTETPDAAAVSCMTESLDGKTGDVLFESLEADSTDTKPKVTLAALETCVPTSVRTEVFATSFAAEGIPQAQADCMAAQLAEQITLEQLVDIDSSGEVSDEFKAKATAAQAACV